MDWLLSESVIVVTPVEKIIALVFICFFLGGIAAIISMSK